MKPGIFLVIILFAFVTCSTVEDVDIGLDHPKLVVNSLFSADSLWRVSVTETINIVDNPRGSGYFRNLENAIVTLYDENNLLIEKLELEPDQNFTTSYRSKKYPEQGKQYTIQVDVEDGATLKATNYVPETVLINTIEVDSSQAENRGEVLLNVIFKDSPGIENFYSIKIIQEGYYLSYLTNDTLSYKSHLYLEAVDPVYDGNFSSSYGLFFNDHLFEGKTVNFKLKLPRSYSSNMALKTKVILSTLTSDYYQYVVSENQQRTSSNDPLAQPSLIFSNVENGLGIFAGYGVSVFDLK